MIGNNSPAPSESSPNQEIVIKTIGLSKHYGDVRAVDGLDLCIRQGEIYGFLGRNGAGKTTTIRLLLGLIRPTGGQVMMLDNWSIVPLFAGVAGPRVETLASASLVIVLLAFAAGVVATIAQVRYADNNQ